MPKTLYGYLTYIYKKTYPNIPFEERKAKTKALFNAILKQYRTYTTSDLKNHYRFLDDEVFKQISFDNGIYDAIINSNEFEETLFGLIIATYDERQRYFDEIHKNKEE